jgi:hypothetical protein
MKFFLADMHIATMQDTRAIFEELGHEVDTLCLSGHAHLIGEEKKQWDFSFSLGEVLTEPVKKQFFEKYSWMMGKYDGFIVNYPPAFAPLYEKFGKPIIMNIPIRYDYPWADDMKKMHQWNDWIKNMQSCNQLQIVCNNKFDQWWLEKNTGCYSEHIPSLCEYTKMQYSGERDEALLYSSRGIKLPGCVEKENLGIYKYDDLAKFKAIVHFPYQVSTMSIFEQYTANIPLYVPEESLLRQFTKEGRALRQLHWSPRTPINFRAVAKYSDYYGANMQHVRKFPSLVRLSQMLANDDHKKISAEMKTHNTFRRKGIMSKWTNLLNQL